MIPANDPNVSPALTGVPAAEPTVVPVVVPAAEPVPAAAVVVPAAEPVVPAVVEPVVTPEVSTSTDNNAFFTSAKAILTKAGLDTNSIVASIEANKGEITPEVLAQLEAKLGVAEANVLVSGYKTELANVRAAQKGEADKIYSIVGGEEAWVKIAAWTATPEANLSKEAAKVYNQMLAAGGVQAELAAKAIMEAYMASPGFTPATPAAAATLLSGDAAPAAVVPGNPISRSEYTAASSKAFNANDAVAFKALEDRARFTMKNHPGLWRGSRIDG